MTTQTIELGSADRLAVLYSYPNTNADAATLAATIEHWINLTLEHDGLRSQVSADPQKYDGASCAVQVVRQTYSAVLSGPAECARDFQTYAARLPQFLEHGWNAWVNDVARIKAGRTVKAWDPILNDWRFFLTHGLTLARPRTVQFFHYPPIRLLALRNYLMDPVPWRCEELLIANGVKDHYEARRYECVMDATPIGASDEQGQLGTIPIDEFYPYQAAQTRLLIGDPEEPTYDPKNGWKNAFTIPIVVYGQHPKRVFSKLFLDERAKICGQDSEKKWISYRDGVLRDDTTVLASNIIPGKQTAVIGSTHPYAFYGTAQVGPMQPPEGQRAGQIGQGYIHRSYAKANAESVYNRMVKDLIIARWQKTMADAPQASPEETLREATQYWGSPERKREVNALVLHQGSLWYRCLEQGEQPTSDDPKSLEFDWKLSLEDAAKLAAQQNDDLPACIEALYQIAMRPG